MPQPYSTASSTELSAPKIENAERLAQQLIRHLGIAGATRTCRENHWDGVLLAVEAQARSRSVV